MSTYKLKNGTWGIDYRDEFGARHRVTVGSEEAAEQLDAIKTLDRAHAAARKKAIEQHCTLTVSDALDIYLRSKPDRSSTLRSQRGQLEAARKILGEEKLTAVTPAMLAAYFNLRRHTLAPSTLAFEKRLVRHLFKVMAEYGMTANNPAAAITDTTSTFTSARALTRDEELTVITATRPSKLPRILLALDAGAHTAELCLLKPEHFQLSAGTVSFPPTKTPWRSRQIPMTGRLQTVMEEAIADSPGSDAHLFPTVRPTNFLTGLKAAIGIQFRFHDLRHTFAHRLTQAGAPEQIIARALGHAPRTITAHYTHKHITADEIRAYIQKLERLAEEHAASKIQEQEEHQPCQESATDSSLPEEP